MIKIGNRIRRARERAGFTQEKLAEKIGISRAAVARYELGEIEPKIKNLVAIAEVLNVSTDYLLGVRNDRIASVLELSDDAMIALETFVRELRKEKE